MFENDKKRYITIGVAETIDIEIQIFLFELIDELVQSKVEIDYLQVFKLEMIRKNLEHNLKVTHSQEVPDYNQEYFINVNTPIDAKIFVIDDGQSYVTMLLAEEY